MRNKLPILLALVLMAVAAMPWLRSLESQRWSLPTSATTVPPPEQAVAQAISAGSTQTVGKPREIRRSRRDSDGSQPSCPVADHAGRRIKAGIRGKKMGYLAEMDRHGDRTRRSTSRSSATGSGLPGIADTSQSAPPKPQTLLDSAVRAVETRQLHLRTHQAARRVVRSSDYRRGPLL